MTERQIEEARYLAGKLSRLKVGRRYGCPVPKAHPALTAEERNLIVRALNCLADLNSTGVHGERAQDTKEG